MDKNIIIILCYVIAVAICLIFPRKKPAQPPSNDYETLMGILDEGIKREIAFKQEEYKLRDIRVIYDFEEDLTEIVKNILVSFSPEYMKELQYYHPKEYIIKYVTKHVKNFLIRYTKENKIKTK